MAAEAGILGAVRVSGLTGHVRMIRHQLSIKRRIIANL